jgi:uncharacterized membrane protein YcaP (DUF421 family)
VPVELVVRASVVFWFLFLLIRGLGKRELAEMTPFELIVLMVVGDLVQQGVTQEDTSITGALLTVSTFGCWVLALSVSTARWPRWRRRVDGVPVVVVHEGRLVEEALRIERVTAEEVIEAAREQGISDLAHVRVGVLETSGRLSFLQTDEERPADPGPPHSAAAI